MVGGIGVRGSKHSHGSDFTPKHCSAYVVGFRPPSVTSQVVQRTRATLLWTMEPSEVGRKRGQQCRFSAAAVQLPFHQDIISALAAAMQSKAKLEAGQQRAALLAQHNEAYSKATYHSIPSGTEAQAQPAAACSKYHAISSGAAAQAQPTAACSKATCHAISSGAAAQAHPAAA